MSTTYKKGLGKAVLEVRNLLPKRNRIKQIPSASNGLQPGFLYHEAILNTNLHTVQAIYRVAMCIEEKGGIIRRHHYNEVVGIIEQPGESGRSTADHYLPLRIAVWAEEDHLRLRLDEHLEMPRIVSWLSGLLTNHYYRLFEDLHVEIQEILEQPDALLS